MQFQCWLAWRRTERHEIGFCNVFCPLFTCRPLGQARRNVLAVMQVISELLGGCIETWKEQQ